MNVLLHGHNDKPHLVAAQQLDESHIRLYQRREGSVLAEDVEFFPFLFLSDPSRLKGYDRKHWVRELAGANAYRFLAVFTRWTDLWEAVRLIIENERAATGQRMDGYTDVASIHLRPDPVSQYLMQSGTTLFKDMVFGDLRRLQIRVLASPIIPQRSSPRVEQKILCIALTDSAGWQTILDGRKNGEAAMLKDLVTLLRERDPDVIEGHRIFEHDLALLLQRARHYEQSLAIGRDGSEPRLLQARWASSDPESDTALIDIAGRHLLDTHILAEAWDFSRRSLESLDLSALGAHFDPGQPDRPDPLARPDLLYQEDPKQIHRMLLRQASDIRVVSDHLSPSSFYMTQMVPLSFGVVARTGSAAKIESLLVREYLRQKHSIPRPSSGSQTTGGYADVFMTGVFDRVLLADVQSLYPSIMVQRAIKPASDELGIFPALLQQLVERRLAAKRAMNSESDPTQHARLDALQSAFKILINSFYGYLAYNRGLFNDHAQADQVTKTGQALLRRILREVDLHNGHVLEVDTDGVYFVPPDNVEGEEAEASLVQKISDSLPQGIELVPSGRFRRMLSYKKKNYALLGYDGTLTIRGSALISRSMERFLRRFLRLSVSNLLDQNIAGLHTLYATIAADIAHHRWDASDFCRTETIHDSFSAYERDVSDGKRNPAAAYEVIRRAGQTIRPGDKVSYYVTGTAAGVKVSENSRLAEEWDPNFPDENTAYYLDRLAETAGKFEVFFTPEDFRKIFTVDDLFGFDPAGILIQARRMAPGEDTPPADLDDPEGFRIWLGEA